MKKFLESPNLIETVKTETARANNDAQQLVAGLSEEQLNWKPAPDKWSIAECLDHLTISTGAFKPYLTQALQRGRAKWTVAAPPSYKPTMMGGWLAKQLLPDSERKMSAPKVFRPAASTISNALGRFLEQQAEFLELVSRFERVDYNKTRLRSPVTPLMRYSVADAFVIVVVHAQRHLGQARRVREMADFPA